MTVAENEADTWSSSPQATLAKESLSVIISVKMIESLSPMSIKSTLQCGVKLSVYQLSAFF